MPQTVYHVQHPYDKVNRHSDTSWKSFTCALLIFATLAFLLFFLAWPWNFGRSRGDNRYENGHGRHSKVYSDNARKDLKTSTESAYDTPDDTEQLPSTDTNPNASTANNGLYGKLIEYTTTITTSATFIATSASTDAWVSIEKTPCPIDTEREIGSLVNREIDPCENFYSYACSGSSSKTVSYLSSKAARRNETVQRIKGFLGGDYVNGPEYKKKYKEYFESCVNYNPKEDCLSHMRNVIGEAGKFLSPTSTVPKLSTTFSTLILQNFPLFFDVQIGILNGTKKFGPIISAVPLPLQSDFEKNFKEYGRSIKNNAKSPIDLKTAYKSVEGDFEETFLNKTRDVLFYTEVFNENVKQEEIDSIMKTLSEQILPQMKNAYPNEEPEYIPFGQLKSQLASENIDWDVIMKFLLKKNLEEDEIVKVHNLKFLEQIFNSTCNIEQRNLHNAMMAIYLNYLGETFKVEQSTITNRHDFCTEKTIHMMEDVSSSLYMDSFGKDDIQQTADLFVTLFNKIKPQGEETSDIQLRTVKDYPICDANALNSNFMSGTKYMKFKNNFIEDSVLLEKRNRRMMFRTFSLDPNNCTCMWDLKVNSYETDIKTIPELGLIVAPIGVTLRNYDTNNLAGNLQVSDLAFKIAKATHGREIQFDRREPNVTVPLVVEDIDGYTVQIELSPDMSKGQRGSDIQGAKRALAFYKERDQNIDRLPCSKETTQQLFFINIAQEFCTTESIYDSFPTLHKSSQLYPLLRINTLAGGLAEFADAFKCEDKVMKGIVGEKN